MAPADLAGRLVRLFLAEARIDLATAEREARRVGRKADLVELRLEVAQEPELTLRLHELELEGREDAA